jgi:hypothetical protein
VHTNSGRCKHLLAPRWRQLQQPGPAAVYTAAGVSCVLTGERCMRLHGPRGAGSQQGTCAGCGRPKPQRCLAKIVVACSAALLVPLCQRRHLHFRRPYLAAAAVKLCQQPTFPSRKHLGTAVRL